MTYLYQTLADQFISEIQSGGLLDGQRVPSIRDLGQQRGVSITTAQKCYELLEAQGYLVAKAQSGFFVRSRYDELEKPRFKNFKPQIEPISNAELLDEILSLASEDKHVQLGTVQLAAELLPIELLTRSLVRASRRSSAQSMMYSAAKGEAPLREALSAHFSMDGIHFSPDDLIITNGCMDALHHAIDMVSQPGDTIAIPSPCFSGQLQLLASMGRNIMEIPSSSEGLDLEQLEAAMRNTKVKACLITTCFQNPLGYSISIEDKQRIVSMAEANKCPILEDDVFGECGFTKGRPLPLKSWDQKGIVIWCGSFSKTLAAGYRIGWCVAGVYQDQMRQHLRSRYLSVNTPLQLALADFINSGDYRRHLDKLRLALIGQVEGLYGSIIRHFGNSCRSAKPIGGYAVWIQLSNDSDALSLYRKAKDEGINIVPGHIFSATSLYDNCIRLNAGNPWTEDIDRAIQKLADLSRQV